jgi:uncharacterized radical SAM superfamily Fe-S cluster-containing enzyme
VLLRDRPGQIRARIVERNGGVHMEKSCPRHGEFREVLSTDARFTRRIESLDPGRDMPTAPDDLHDHGPSSIRYGRGAVLTVDLTNRCNMMCNPCFMDANQVGYVHELAWEDVRQILDNAAGVRPRRQLSVQFSGGEPTIHPFFLDAVLHAHELGFFSIQAATNGIRFAQEPGFAEEAARAGLRLAYLQFDGTSNESHAHRAVGNLFDVKQRAIDNLHAAGIDVTLVITVVNGINNDQVGPVIRFAIDNIDKINALAFQPISFSGRDEDVDEETRRQQRYTLSQLAHDVRDQLGVTEPMRDWFPLSASGVFSDLVDQLNGPGSSWGALKCGCHPDCGVGTLLLVNEKTHEAVPLGQVVDLERLLADLRTVVDSGRGRTMTAAQAALALARSFRPDAAPAGMGPIDVVRIADGHSGRRMGVADRARYEWRVLLVGGMWFQDLFTYDFRRTEQCVIPYGTQLGEISFCAYNTGVGFRHLVEKLFQTATTAEWYRTQGRHRIYAGGRNVDLPGEAGEAEAPPAGPDLPAFRPAAGTAARGGNGKARTGGSPLPLVDDEQGPEAREERRLVGGCGASGGAPAK